jgi:hypothetical protein
VVPRREMKQYLIRALDFMNGSRGA